MAAPVAIPFAIRPLSVVALSILALSAASLVAIPMVPVPITLQTLAVTVIAARGGARVAVVAILLWLAAGAVGVPVLAGGTSGLARFGGPTAGYLFAFPIAGLVVGRLADRGWIIGIRRALAAMLLGNAICLAIGGAWLAYRIGVAPAWSTGIGPFLPGAALKAVVGALILTASGGRRAVTTSR